MFFHNFLLHSFIIAIPIYINEFWLISELKSFRREHCKQKRKWNEDGKNSGFCLKFKFWQLNISYFITWNFIFLRQAGNQIQGVTRTAYKIEREAAGTSLVRNNESQSCSFNSFLDFCDFRLGVVIWHAFISLTPGLKDILKELPRREASLFRSEVSF